MASAPLPITAWQTEREEKVEVVTDFLILGSKITADGDCSHKVRRQLPLGRKALTNLDSVEKQKQYSADEGPYGQGYGIPRGHVSQWFWDLDHKKGRAPKNWCLRTVVLEKAPESLLDSKEIKPVNLKGDQPWIFTGKTYAEALVFWSSDANRWLIGKVPDAGEDQVQKEKTASEDETAR